MVASAFSLISTPSFLPSSRSAPGCSRHVEACWRRNTSTGGNSQPLRRSIPHAIGGRRRRTGSSIGSNTATTAGRGSAAGAVALMAERKAANRREVVVPEPDYRIPIVLLGFAGLLVYQDNLLAAAPVGLLGLLLLFQTTRVRFVFDDEALEVKVGDQLQESGENVFVGGKNRWKLAYPSIIWGFSLGGWATLNNMFASLCRYSTFVNWELWWPNFPILVYFKEKQTKPEGQVHFFPVIFNGKQLYDVMVERAGPSKTSGPKQT